MFIFIIWVLFVERVNIAVFSVPASEVEGGMCNRLIKNSFKKNFVAALLLRRRNDCNAYQLDTKFNLISRNGLQVSVPNLGFFNKKAL